MKKNELLIFKENLIAEYDYYLDLFDRVKELGTYSIEDYEKAIKNYDEFKKKYKRGIIISGTLSGTVLAGLVALYAASCKEASVEIISFFSLFSAVLGGCGSYIIADECLTEEHCKYLAVNNSLQRLKEKQEKIITETNILFKDNTNLPNIDEERETIRKRIAILECAIEYISELEKSLAQKLILEERKNILYNENFDLSPNIADIRSELSYGYYLVKRYL